jgi:endoglucanase
MQFGEFLQEIRYLSRRDECPYSAAGAKTQCILIPGSTYSSAGKLPTEAGPYLLNVTDPAGDKSKLLFDVHRYLDVNGAGTEWDCTSSRVDDFTYLANWLKTNNRKAFLSETGGSHKDSCVTE